MRVIKSDCFVTIWEQGNSIFPPCLTARRAGRRYAPFAIHAFGHCGFCLFRCPAQEPKCAASLPAEASAQAGGTSRSPARPWNRVLGLDVLQDK